MTVRRKRRRPMAASFQTLPAQVRVTPAVSLALWTWASRWAVRGWTGIRALAPYAAIEILLPGGTLLALLYWLYRRHRQASIGSATFRLPRTCSGGSGGRPRIRSEALSAIMTTA